MKTWDNDEAWYRTQHDTGPVPEDPFPFIPNWPIPNLRHTHTTLSFLLISGFLLVPEDRYAPIYIINQTYLLVLFLTIKILCIFDKCQLWKNESQNWVDINSITCIFVFSMSVFVYSCDIKYSFVPTPTWYSPQPLGIISQSCSDEKMAALPHSHKMRTHSFFIILSFSSSSFLNLFLLGNTRVSYFSQSGLQSYAFI